MAARFQLQQAKDGRFYFNLRAANDEVLLTGRRYESPADLELAIESVRRFSSEKELYRAANRRGRYHFVLLDPDERPIGRSGAYDSEEALQDGIRSLARNAADAEIEALTDRQAPANDLRQLDDQDLRHLRDLGLDDAEIRGLSAEALDAAVTFARGVAGAYKPLTRSLHQALRQQGDDGDVSSQAREHAHRQAFGEPASTPSRARVGGIPAGAVKMPDAHVARGTSAGLHHDNSGWTALGPYMVGGRTRSIVVDPADTKRLWAAAVDGGVLRSDDRGVTWHPTEDLMGNMAVCALAMGPDPAGSGKQFLYAGTGEWVLCADGAPGGGLFVSEDGWSWEQIPVTRPTEKNERFRNVMGLAVTGDGKKILAATGRGLHAIAWNEKSKKSSKWEAAAGGFDAGIKYSFTWGTKPLTFYDYFVRIAIDPKDDKKAIAGGRFGTVKYTLDGGKSWTDATFKPTGGADTRQIGQTIAVCYAAADSKVVYASVYMGGNPRSQVYRSDDGGKTFQQRSAKLDEALIQANRAWIGYNRDGSKKYDQRVVNGGMTGDQGNYGNVIWAGHPKNADLVLVSGLNIFRSTDGAQNFAPISTWQSNSSVHADHHAITADPGFGKTNQRVYFGNDGGVFKTEDVTVAGFDPTTPNPRPPFDATWENLNKYYSVTQFYYGAGNLAKRAVLGGAQDNGTWAHSRGNLEWDSRIIGGDGTCAAADPTLYYDDPANKKGEYTLWYAALPRLVLKRAKRTERVDKDGVVTASWSTTDISSDIGGTKPFVAPIVLDPIDPKILYAGTSGLWYTLDATTDPVDWNDADPSNVAGGKVSAIAAGRAKEAGAKGRADLALVGTESGKIVHTTDLDAATPAWTDIGATIGAGRPCTALAIDPTADKSGNTSTYYAGFAGLQKAAQPGNVWKTTDGGTTWKDVSQGMIQMPVHAITLHPRQPGWVYLGTDFGIFASEDGGATWSRNNEGPANTAVYDLFWMGQTLVAATHGRGMFQIDLTMPRPQAVLAGDIRGRLHSIDPKTGAATGTLLLDNQQPLSGVTAAGDVKSIADVLGSTAAPDKKTQLDAIDVLAGLAFVGDAAGSVYGVDVAKMQVTWQATVSGAVAASPRIWLHPEQHKVYLLVATANGTIEGFDVVDTLSKSTAASPAAKPDLVVKLSVTGNVDVLTFETMDHWAYVACSSGVFGANLVAAKPAQAWKRTGLVPTAPMLVAANTLYVPTAAGLYSVEARSGHDAHRSVTGRKLEWPAKTAQSISARPAWVLGAVAFATDGGKVIGVDHRDGHRLFEIDGIGRPVRSLAAGDNRLYFATNVFGRSQLFAYDVTPAATGDWSAEKAWAAKLPRLGSTVTPAVQEYVDDTGASQLMILLPTNDASIHAFDAKGSPLFNARSLGQNTDHSPAVAHKAEAVPAAAPATVPGQATRRDAVLGFLRDRSGTDPDAPLTDEEAEEVDRILQRLDNRTDAPQAAMAEAAPMSFAAASAAPAGTPGVAAKTPRKRVYLAMAVDNSGSMSSGLGGEAGTKMDAAVTDAGSIIYLMQNDDKLGAVSFSSDVKVGFPSGGSTAKTLKVVDDGQDDRSTASNFLFGLKASGNTDIVGALEKCKGMLNGLDANGVPAIALLTDGNQTVYKPDIGYDITRMSTAGYPKVYTIGLGVDVDAHALTAISQATGGEYHYTPTQGGLQQIYNEIASGTTIAQLLANEKQNLQPFLILKASAQLAAKTTQVLFLVNWQDQSLEFRRGQAPGAGEIAVEIMGPAGRPLANAEVVIVGNGFAVFFVQGATAGSYTAQGRIMRGTAKKANLTIGIFDPSNINQLLTRTTQQAIVTGQQPIEFLSAAMGEPGQVHGATQVSVTMEHPLMAPEQAIALHQPTLDAMDRADDRAGGVQRSRNAKLLDLQETLDQEILPMGVQTLPVTTHPQSGGDLHHFSHVPTVPGPHVAHMKVIARDEEGNPFTLAKRVSFWAY